MDPVISTILVAGGLFGCGFYAGVMFCQRRLRDIVHAAIANTIDNLIRDGFLATGVDEDGDQTIRRVGDVVQEAVDFLKKT